MAQSVIGIAVCDCDFTVRFSNTAIRHIIGPSVCGASSASDKARRYHILRLLDVDDVTAVIGALKRDGRWQGDTAGNTRHIAIEKFEQDERAGGWLISVRPLATFRSTLISERELIASSTKLTRREREVTLALEEGESNKGIALRLGISPRTVEFHRAKIMRRFAANSIVDLIRKVVAEARLSRSLERPCM